MSKRKQKEQEIIQQMEQALKEQGLQTPTQKRQAPTRQKRGIFRSQEDVTPTVVHCKRCKTLMEKGVCPTCGYKIYVPMDEEKRKKIKLAMTVVAVVVFIALFVALHFKNN